MQFFAATLALASVAAALPADLTARSFTGGRCRVELKSSANSLSGSWSTLKATFYDGAGKKATSGSADNSEGIYGHVLPFKLAQGSGGIPHDLSITPYIPEGKTAPLMVQPLATLVYAGFTFDGNNDVCEMHVDDNIVTGMTCGFGC